MNSKINFYITYNAQNSIDKHIQFLSNVSIKAAIKLNEILKDYILILKYFPKIGKMIYKIKEPPIQFRKLVINKQYILIYYIQKNNVFIDDILDARQNNSNKI